LEAIQYKCPNCGGGLEYKADRQKFGCDFCLSEFTEQEVKEIFRDNESVDLTQNVRENISADNEFAGGNLYSCSSCGAEIMSDANTAATFCVYCHNPVILTGRLSGDYRPNKIVPFVIEKNKAIEIFKSGMLKRLFIPSGFKSEQTLEKMTGLYVPFWLADCNVKTNMQAIGKHIRTWKQGDYKYTETREYAVSRHAGITFNGVPADGASKIDDSLMDALEPFDYSKLQNFSMSYLTGFLADKYDVDKGQVFPRIRQKLDTASRDILMSSITGYSSVSVSNFTNNIMKTDWNYALLPVWFMTYSYNGKMYEFAVNGQSGKLVGIPPLSKKKLFAFCLGLFAVITALFGLGGYLLS